MILFCIVDHTGLLLLISSIFWIIIINLVLIMLSVILLFIFSLDFLLGYWQCYPVFDILTLYYSKPEIYASVYHLFLSILLLIVILSLSTLMFVIGDHQEVVNWIVSNIWLPTMIIKITIFLCLFSAKFSLCCNSLTFYRLSLWYMRQNTKMMLVLFSLYIFASVWKLSSQV